MRPSQPYRDPARRWYSAGLTGISLPIALACAVGLLFGRVLWSAAGAVIRERSHRWMVDYFTGTQPADQNLSQDGLIDFMSQSIRFSSKNILLSGPWLLLQCFAVGLFIALIVQLGDFLTQRVLHARLAHGGPTLEYPPLAPILSRYAFAAIGFGFLAAMCFGISAEFSGRAGLSMGIVSDSMHAASIAIGFALWCVLLRAPRWWARAKVAQHERHRSGRTCFRCGYNLLGPSSPQCPECGQFPPPLQAARASRSAARRALFAAAIIAAWCLAAALTGAFSVPALPKALYYTARFDVLGLTPASVLPLRVPTTIAMLPHSRPVRIDGPWGRLWVLALELPNHQMLVRTVFSDDTGSAASPEVQTLLFGSNSPVTAPKLGPKLFLLRTSTRNYCKLDFGEPDEHVVLLWGLTPPPQRITGFPNADEAPPEIAVLLSSPDTDAEYERAIGGQP